MKTSRSQQEQTRRQIIRCAVDLISTQGYDKTSMKQIARTAGIGDATIYKYFPTKEKLLLAYFALCIEVAVQMAQETPEWEEFDLHESLQRLLDLILELLLNDREFVEITRQVMQQSPLLMLRDQIPGQALLKETVVSLIEAAEQRGEIPACDFKNLMGNMVMDYLLAVISYWLDDDSEEFADTTHLVDMSLGVFVAVLKSGLINKLTELASFMLRTHLSRLLQHGGGLGEIIAAFSHKRRKAI